MKTLARCLDRTAWEGIARNCREADAALLRIAGALLHPCPVRVHDRWAALRRDVASLKQRLVDSAYDQFGPDSRAADLFARRPGLPEERTSYGWPQPASLRKRPLTREEWVTIGDDVKRCRVVLTAVGMSIQPSSTKAECRRWFRIVDRIDSLKCSLDDTVYRQHPDWEEFSRVFYGEPSRDNPKLAASLRPAARSTALNLGDELSRRNNCRAGLVGLQVATAGSDRPETIRSTAWDKDTRLLVTLESGQVFLAEGLTLVSKWPATCCRPSKAGSKQ
jgi:hypothetical protein